MSRTLTIATRESPLALWQAEYVRDALQAAHPGLEVKLLGMTSRGDQLLDVPLAKVGGKGLFVKELETALLDGSADIAVHSMKDVPMEFPEGLGLGVICEREDPSDAFIRQWESDAGLMTIGEAVAEVMSFRAEEGVDLPMSVDEWREFAKDATSTPPVDVLDIWKRQFYATIEDDTAALHTRHMIGEETLLWGSDYPHTDSTWPCSTQVLDEMFQDISPETRDKVTRTNVANLYDL